MTPRTAFAFAFALALSTLFSAACHSSPQSAAVNAGAQTIGPAALQADLQLLQQAVAQRHPRLQGQSLPAVLAQQFDKAHADLSQPLSRAAAFRHFAGLNPYFSDAHTLVMPLMGDPDQDDDAPRFPLKVCLNDEGTLALCQSWSRRHDGLRLAEGTRITAINGVASTVLLDELQAFSHGETAPLRRHMLTLMFPKWLAVLRGWVGAFELTVSEQSRTRVIRLEGTDRWSSERSVIDSELPSLRVIEEGLGLLSIPTFDVDEVAAAYRQAIDAAFLKVRQQRLQALIIDVRGNTGGQSDAAEQIIRYITDRPVNLVSQARERLHAGNRGWFGYRGRAGQMREMDLSRDGLVKPLDAAMRFQGRVVLLIDEMTYSASILFATCLQDHRLATLVGRPTGGFSNQTGNMEPLLLPHTGFTAYIPSREFVRPSGRQALEPVMPELVVPAQAGSDDAVLGAATRLLRQPPL